MSSIDSDQYEIHLTFEIAVGAVTPPEGSGWQLWTTTADGGGGDGLEAGVWFVWYRRRKGTACG